MLMNGYKLENIEWTRVWREQCTAPNNDRVLLIGDSIIDGCKIEVSKALAAHGIATTLKNWIFSASKRIFVTALYIFNLADITIKSARLVAMIIMRWLLT